MIFYWFFAFVGLQRLAELLLAKKNEQWMKDRGAEEFGQGHYLFMVFMHLSFFFCLFLEVQFFGKEINTWWPQLMAVFGVLQLLRVWVIVSLGKSWNTKIIVLQGAEVVAKGPFKWIKHPNYLIVTLELLIIPFMFQAYGTLLLFAVLNQLILYTRIRVEEKALKELTNYGKIF